jgi:uncharacterized protein YcaQ
MPNPIKITLQKARRLVLAYHNLYPPRSLKGKQGILSYLGRVRSIQFDPINVVGRNPDLVLQSRIKNFQPSTLDEMLYRDRLLFDSWDKMACLSLAEDWPCFSRHRSRMEDLFGVPSEVVSTLAPEVISQIKDQGPQCSLDFSHQQKTDWAWGPTRVSRAALEGLFRMGQLGIHHRVNNRRYFDLIENLLPEELLLAEDPHPDLETYQDWHVLRRIKSLGLAHANAGEQWGGIMGVKSPRRQRIITGLTENGDLLEIEVEGLDGDRYYLPREHLPVLNQHDDGSHPLEAAFIAPLDNLLWDRKSLARLFDFNYMWEVYKPQKDRQYGYYVLPVLLGDRFIARFDPAFDKNTRKLTINNWWWEEGAQIDKKAQNALKRCMGDFLVYLGAQSLEITPQLLDGGDLDWLGDFR